jgi:hypothetical protein
MFTLEETESGAVRVNWLGESEVSAQQLLATPREEEHADARSEAVEFLSAVLANDPVPASEIIQDAEDAGIAEKTLRRAKKLLGVVAYREGETGKRGGGRWLWRLPVPDLVTRDDKGGQTPIQDGHSTQQENVGHLDPANDTRVPGSGLCKPDVQDGHHDDLDGHEILDGQGGQDGHRSETDYLERCIHGFAGGKGCYLCDPNHPYRIEQEGTR